MLPLLLSLLLRRRALSLVGMEYQVVCVCLVEAGHDTSESVGRRLRDAESRAKPEYHPTFASSFSSC